MALGQVFMAAMASARILRPTKVLLKVLRTVPMGAISLLQDFTPHRKPKIMTSTDIDSSGTILSSGSDLMDREARCLL
jgi:hypothetical protein